MWPIALYYVVYSKPSELPFIYVTKHSTFLDRNKSHNADVYCGLLIA